MRDIEILRKRIDKFVETLLQYKGEIVEGGGYHTEYLYYNEIALEDDEEIDYDEESEEE